MFHNWVLCFVGVCRADALNEVTVCQHLHVHNICYRLCWMFNANCLSSVFPSVSPRTVTAKFDCLYETTFSTLLSAVLFRITNVLTRFCVLFLNIGAVWNIKNSEEKLVLYWFPLLLCFYDLLVYFYSRTVQSV